MFYYVFIYLFICFIYVSGSVRFGVGASGSRQFRLAPCVVHPGSGSGFRAPVLVRTRSGSHRFRFARFGSRGSGSVRGHLEENTAGSPAGIIRLNRNGAENI